MENSNKNGFRILYETRITGIGDMCEELFDEVECLVFFNDDILEPSIREISILHEKSKLLGSISKGDFLSIGDDIFEITAIGKYAQDSLKNIGHFTIKFNGSDEIELPGEINVVKGEPKLEIGKKLAFLKKEGNICTI